MNADLIVKLLIFGAGLIKDGIDLYNKYQSTMSETDIVKVKAALAEAQATTANIRPIVDAALDEAAKNA